MPLDMGYDKTRKRLSQKNEANITTSLAIWTSNVKQQQNKKKKVQQHTKIPKKPKDRIRIQLRLESNFCVEQNT